MKWVASDAYFVVTDVVVVVVLVVVVVVVAATAAVVGLAFTIFGFLMRLRRVALFLSIGPSVVSSVGSLVHLSFCRSVHASHVIF